MPAFPPQTFKEWFENRGATQTSGKSIRGEVILWADTFNNHFFPYTAKAAVEVLEDAGFRVTVPKQRLCCGRPLYDFGFLEQAKQHLREILTTLQPEIAAGTPIVCLEPSCASVFRDELKNLFPDDQAASRLQKQVILFADFLEQAGYKPLPLRGKALVHGHCHQKALFSMTPEQRMLQAMAIEPELLNSGCCGLAGTFGYEAEHYDISMQIGERILLPRVRSAARDTFIVADGFSCRQQIMHGTHRRAMHLAEVMQMALHPPRETKRKYAETGYTQHEPGYPFLAALASLGVLAGGLAYLLSRSHRKVTAEARCSPRPIP